MHMAIIFWSTRKQVTDSSHLVHSMLFSFYIQLPGTDICKIAFRPVQQQAETSTVGKIKNKLQVQDFIDIDLDEFVVGNNLNIVFLPVLELYFPHINDLKAGYRTENNRLAFKVQNGHTARPAVVLPDQKTGCYSFGQLYIC
jgi:hypothetical protein